MKLYDAGATLIAFFVISTFLLGVAHVALHGEDKKEPCIEEHYSTITPCKVENK